MSKQTDITAGANALTGATAANTQTTDMTQKDDPITETEKPEDVKRNMAKTEMAKAGTAKLEPTKPRIVRPKVPKLKELTAQALICLSEMITDEGSKPADRLNAVKTVLDYAGRLPSPDADSRLKVVFEGIDPGYTE